MALKDHQQKGSACLWNIVMVIYLIVQSRWIALIEADTIRCPSVCLCDNKEKFVMCQEKNLSHLPFPLPSETHILGLSQNHFTGLTSSMFIDTGLEESLKSLVLYDNRIASIEPGSFLGLQKLSNLWLFGNQLTTLEKGTFEGMNMLAELDLSRNYLVNIEDGTFDGLKKLEVLHLWGNKLKTLHTNAFQGLNSLSNLSLGDNKFEAVPSNAFPHLTNLSSLELLNLPIEKLQANAFVGLSNLKRLHIGDWPLTQIDEAAFAGLDNLRYLSLYRCNLIQIPQTQLAYLPHLKHLVLSNNKNIRSLKRDDFQGNLELEDLLLSNIGLSTIHESPFHLLTSVKNLDLSVNKLSVLPSHAFLQMEHLHSLNLSHNAIQSLSYPLFIPLSVLNNVDLQDNPLVCDCDIKWLRLLREMRIKEQFTLKGQCSDPSILAGKDIITLQTSKFICQAPVFHKNKTVVARIGSNVSLSCQPDEGVPTPKSIWTIKQTDHSTHLVTKKDGTLFITKVKTSDYGAYTCEASNKLGSADHTVFLVEHVPVAQTSGGATTGILVALTVIVVLVSVVVLYRRYGKGKFGSSLYDAMLGETENQRLSMKGLSKGA
ncbi:uncharacterized protein LOC108951031 [Ciona intestinalis]